MNLAETNPKGIKVIVEVDGSIINSTPKTKEKKKATNYWLILLLAVITTFILFPESIDTVNEYYKQQTERYKLEQKKNANTNNL